MRYRENLGLVSWNASRKHTVQMDIARLCDHVILSICKHLATLGNPWKLLAVFDRLTLS